MKNSKRVIAFLIAMTVVGANDPVALSRTLDIVAFADNIVTNSINIILQPTDYSGKIGDQFRFEVKAEGTGLKYQWQWRSNERPNWGNTGAAGNGTSILSDILTNERVGNQYRCVITDSNGNSVISEAVTLKEASLSITSQPTDYSGKIGDQFRFEVKAEGTGLKYQWQWRPNVTTKWVNTSAAGNTTAVLSDTLTSGRVGNQYRCVITDSSGNVIESDVCTLRESESQIIITSQPTDYSGKIGDQFRFEVKAEGTGLKYQWQWRPDINTNWGNTGAAGNTTAVLSDTLTSGRVGNQYRCVITDSSGNSVISEAVTLKEASLSITSQPTDYSGKIGDQFRFEVKAEGTGLKYQWQWRPNEATNWAFTGASGNKTSVLNDTITSSRIGNQYRCIITDSAGNSVTSDVVTLKEKRTPITISELSSITVLENNNVTFSIDATGDNINYQWQTAVTQLNADAPIDWIDIEGATSSAYTFKAKFADDGKLFRCIVSNDTESINSTVATLTVTPAYAVIGNDTKEISMNFGDAYQLDLTGKGLRYYSNTKDLNVDKYGVVTANNPVYCGYVFVLDKYGHKTFYKIHVEDPHEDLEFDETVVVIRPCQSVRLYTNKNAQFMIGDTDRSSISGISTYNTYYWSDINNGIEFYAEIPGEYDVIAYNDNGEMSTATVIVEGDVEDAEANTEYQGVADEESNIWYRYTNDSDTLVMVTFDYYSIYPEGQEHSEYELSEITLYDGCFSVYYEGNWINANWTEGNDLENKQIFLEPGQELYVNPHAYEMINAAYDFKINVTPYATVDYSVGTTNNENTVNNVVLDRKDFTDYVFTTGDSGEYDLMATSMTNFYWQLKDLEGDNWFVAEGWEDDGAVSQDFTLKANHEYGLRFIPYTLSETGTLSFSMTKANDTVTGANVNQTYNREIINKNSTKYYSFTIGNGTDPQFDVYEFIGNGNVSYEVLGSDMYTAYDKMDNFGRYYAVEPTTIYIKVTNNNSTNQVADFTLKKLERSIVQTNDPLPLDNTDYTAAELSNYQVNWYEFTAPATGSYNFGINAYNSSVPVQCEFFEKKLSSEPYQHNSGTDNYWGYAQLHEGEKVYVKVTGGFDSYNADSKATYDWYFVKVDGYNITDLALDTPTEGATVDGQTTYFKFTAPEKGTYYFWSQARAIMVGTLYHVIGGDTIRYSEYGGYDGNFCIEYRMSKGETVYLHPEKYISYYDYDQNKDCEYEVMVSRSNNAYDWRPAYDHQALTLGTAKSGHITDSYLFDTFSFTATEAGTYVFTGDSNDYIYADLYSDAALNEYLTGNSNSHFRITYDLAAGQTVYLKPYYTYNQDYTVKVIKRNVSNVQIKSGLTYTDQTLAPESEVWYEFTAPEFDENPYDYYFYFNSNKAIDAVTYYKDENGKYQVKNDNGWESIYETTNNTIEVFLNPGETIYIKMNAYSPSDTVNYSLEVSGGVSVGDRSFVLPEEYDLPSDSIRSYESYGTEMWVRIENPNQLGYDLTFESVDSGVRNLLVEFYTADGVLITSDEATGNTITFINPFEYMTADDSIVYYVHIVEQDEVELGNIQISYEPTVYEEGSGD